MARTVTNNLTKEDDNELKKLAAIFAYAANQSTPGTAKDQENRIYNTVHMALMTVTGQVNSRGFISIE